MTPFPKGLDDETGLLVAAGAAVAAGCIPCLERITALAEAAGIDSKKMKSAAIIGQLIREQPAAHMKEAADRLLGTHLQAAAPARCAARRSPVNRPRRHPLPGRVKVAAAGRGVDDAAAARQIR